MSEQLSTLDQIKVESDLLREWQYQYYVLGRPTVSDLEYDSHFDRLSFLEKENPQYGFEDSPTQRVGSDLSQELPESEHSIPVLSLDKSYSVEELLDWRRKMGGKSRSSLFSLVVEEKIDGISIVLYYENGLLVRAVTRGNGSVGNDVTSNVKTIGSVPLRLKEPLTVAVRGEIYLPIDSFEKLNKQLEVPYSNPRNLAAGTIRRKKSSEAAAVPLQIFIYEGFFEEALQLETHFDVLEKLKSLGFRLNERTAWFSSQAPDLFSSFQSIDQLGEWVEKMTAERPTLGYEIDGLVLKINELGLREELGYTGHHPRWAIAYKFDSPMGESVIQSIDVQIGRTGRVTPVARIEPVEISGSVVSNVTLHNQDYINALEAAVGDRVSVSKRGDVIPAVESVLEKGDNGAPWQMPKTCPSCQSELVISGAHLFCRNRHCPDQQKGRLLFFASRSQMDIDGLGDETIDFLFRESLIANSAELFSFDYNRLLDYPGFGDKKISQIQKGLKAALDRPYERLLASLGFPDIGPKVCELLVNAGFDSIDKLIEAAKADDQHLFEAIHGIGPQTASGIVRSLTDATHLQLIADLKSVGFSFIAKIKEQPLSAQFEGQRWCVTGSFENFKPRTLAADEIKKRGGQISSAISGSTTHLLAGEKAGSKLVKAQELGVLVVNEQDFLRLLQED